MLQYYAATFPKIYYLMKAKMEKINILILTSSVVCVEHYYALFYSHTTFI